MRHGHRKKKSDDVAPAAQKPAQATAPKPASRPVIPSISIKEAIQVPSSRVEVPSSEVEIPSSEVEISGLKIEVSGSETVNLKSAWNDFADTMKDDARLYSMLTANSPNLKGETKIVFQISNALQKEPFQKIEPLLLQHLRSASGNENLEIEIVIAEKGDISQKAYTAEERFAQMSRKNPALITFRQQFMLDFV